MAEDLKRSAEVCTLDLLVLHEHDGLFIKYSDGTSLELSPCGSVFLHREADPSNSTMRQFTRFALSSFRTKITEAVRFRNLFAAQPYLCKELTDLQELRVGCFGHYETDMRSHLGLSVYRQMRNFDLPKISISTTHKLTLYLILRAWKNAHYRLSHLWLQV